jgi:Zn-dependent protease with chaperone function
MSFQADFFDGVSARAHQVLVLIEHGNNPGITFDIDQGESLFYPFPAITIQAKLGQGKRLINLSDGGRLEAFDIHELEALLASNTSAFNSLINYLENHLGWVALSLALTIFAGWGFLKYGVPALAEQVVKATPASMEIKLGEEVLKGLDHKMGYFSASKTPLPQQKNISNVLENLCNKLRSCPWHRLEFRDGGAIGANAFALPGGIIVVTDQLVLLAQNNTEVVSVLAHELGHVKQRHAFRQSIQGVLSGLILAAITGDVSSTASGLGGFLVEMNYSQVHESEADGFALNAMQTACLPPKAYADILLRLDAELTETKDQQVKSNDNMALKQKLEALGNLLSTHPNTKERVKPFLHAKQNCA